MYAVMAAFVLIFTNVTQAKYFFYDHIKVHNPTYGHEPSAKHSSDGLHDHEREDAYTHSHTDENGDTHSHKHHHDHCTKLASPIIACLYASNCEPLTAISSFLLYSWIVFEPILTAHFRELLRPPILA